MKTSVAQVTVSSNLTLSAMITKKLAYKHTKYQEYHATADNPHHISCGGVIYRLGKAGVTEILLLHRFKKKSWAYDSWHLPKGTQRVGESEKECALREIKEETGYEVEIRGRLLEVKSTDKSWGFKFDKTTHYFFGTPLRKTGIGDSEHDEKKWLELSLAKKLLGKFPLWEDEKAVLEEFEKKV